MAPGGRRRRDDRRIDRQRDRPRHGRPGGAGDVTECKFEYTPASAFNNVEEVTVSGATGGTYKLYDYVKGEWSEPIPYNATLTEFSQALEAKWGAGTVSVTGTDGGPYTVELVGPQAGTNPGNPFSVDESSLTPARRKSKSS